MNINKSNSNKAVCSSPVFPCFRALLAATWSAVSPLRSFWRTSALCLSNSRRTASSPREQARCSGLLCLLPWEKFTSRSECFRRYDFSFRRLPSSTYFHTRPCLWDTILRKTPFCSVCVFCFVLLGLGLLLRQFNSSVCYNSCTTSVPRTECFQGYHRVSLLTVFIQVCICFFFVLFFFYLKRLLQINRLKHLVH